MTFKNFLRGVIVGAISLLYISLTSCGSYKKRILDKYCKTDSANAVVNIDTTLKTPPQETEINFNCDSLKNKYDSLAKISVNPIIVYDTIEVNGKPTYEAKKGILIHSDSIADIYYSVSSNGNIKFKIKTKPQPVRYKASKPIKLPCKSISQSDWEKVQDVRWCIICVFLFGIVFGLYLSKR